MTKDGPPGRARVLADVRSHVAMTCHKTQAKAIVEVVEAVVGMREAVADEAANQIELEGLADQPDVPVLLQGRQVTNGGA